MEHVAYVGASVAFLEAGHLIFNTGTGVGKLDMAALTMQRILTTVKKIEGKLDTVLSEPLKTANYILDSANIAITNQSYKYAYDI